MPVTTEDILVDEDAVRAEVQETTEQTNVFRQAFRSMQLGLDMPETVFVLVSNDRRGEVEIVPEGGEFPRDAEDRDRIPITRDKYGEEYSITREAEAGGISDDLAIEARNKMRKIGRTMDRVAFDVLSSNLNDDAAAPVGDAAGDLTLAEIADAETLLLDDPYRFEPDALFVGPQGLNDLRVNEWLNRDTAGGDEVRWTGRVGDVMGLPVYMSNAGNLGAGEAILADTNYYGREGIWESPQAERYEEEKTQTSTVMQMWSIMGWAAVEPNAAVKIEG